MAPFEPLHFRHAVTIAIKSERNQFGAAMKWRRIFNAGCQRIEVR
jgi:hypothetical protein